MSGSEKKLYEAMFLVDSAVAGSDAEGVDGAIRNILTRADAKVVSLEKWGERRLAYEIKGANRGTYYLCYFNVEPGRIGGIERDVRLEERIMRVLVLCADEKRRVTEHETRDTVTEGVEDG